MSDVGTRTLQWIIDRTVEDEHGCWIWQYKTDTDGYGHTTVDIMSAGVSTNGYSRHKTVSAHRLSFRLHWGYWPEVCHHVCYVKSCCNPAHLESVTTAENMQDASLKGKTGRGTKQPQKAPFRQHTQKVDDLMVSVVHKLYHQHGWLQREIADLFDMTQTGISAILRLR